MKAIRTLPIARLLPALLALGLASACTDDRTATAPGELFHCASDSDCLRGWTCQCGYCQVPGQTQFSCGVSADDASGDSSVSGDASVGTDAAQDAAPDLGGDTPSDTPGDTGGDTGNDAGGPPPVGTEIGVCNQKVSTDVTFKSCNLASWTGCDTGAGCYYAPALNLTLCKPHGILGEGATCDPCNLTECGLAADKHVLICDAVDKICRRTCDLTPPVPATQCPAGEQCYQLVDPNQNNKPYPSSGGICAK